MKSCIEIIKLQQHECALFQNLIELFNEVFEESSKVASKNQLQKLLDKNDFHAFAAIEDDKIIGGITAYELDQYYEDESELYIYDMAVKTEFHNQGIGKALMKQLKDYAKENGIKSILVQAASDEEQAVQFYKSTLGTFENVSLFYLNMKSNDNR